MKGEGVMKLSGNTIFLTGGAAGIGKSLAKQLVQQGNEVIVCGRNEDTLKKAAQEIPGLHYVRCDIGNEADRREAFEYVSKNFPKINVLINNAAIQSTYDFKTGADGLKKMDHELSINLNAPIHLTGLFMPLLLKAENPAVVFITSILGLAPFETKIPIYCIAKSGLHSYILLLRKHLQDTPIGVYEVAPPKVETDIHSAVRADLKAAGREDWRGVDVDVYCKFVVEKLAEDVKFVLYPPVPPFVEAITNAETWTPPAK